MNKSFLFMACAAALSACSNQASLDQTQARMQTVSIDTSSRLFTFHGRTVVDDECCKLGYSMEGFSFKFRGTSAKIECTDESDTYIGVSVDGGEMKQIKAGEREIELASGLRDTVHHVDLYKLTELQTGTICIRSLSVDGEMLDSDERQREVIEFIGNSITCGYGNMCTLSAKEALTGFHSENQNGYMAWGAMAARALGMEYSAVAYSGRGLMVNNDGTTKGLVPELYEQALAEGRKFTPSIVVVNLGSNDFFALGAKSASFEMDEFSAAYRKFVISLMERYPQATIACVIGCMMQEDYPAGEHHLSKVIAATDKAVEGLERVKRIDLEPQVGPYGEDFHPTIARHRMMCDQFVQELRK